MTAEELAEWDEEIADLRSNRDIARKAHAEAKATHKDVDGKSQRQWWYDYLMYRDSYKTNVSMRKTYK